MRIGIVTTWFERGAAYVSRIYMDLLRQEGHEVFIYARGGVVPPKGADKWNEDYVTRDTVYQNSRINMAKFSRWITKNKLEGILFNEQQDFRVVAQTKKKFPHLKLGAYVDYYTEKTLNWFRLYDFLICNTRRHMQAMENHPQKFYMQWGTDITVYTPQNEKHEQITFFHSVGMSTRKGTDILLEAYIDAKLYETSKLVVHTQIPISKACKYDKEYLESLGIQIIEKTVTAPGLYYMGDVYVYPTRLDGLGLTMYEALASGLPVITTDFPPMNEAVNEEVGKLVKVRDYYCRQDAYYYPMVLCDKLDLIRCMQDYIDNPQEAGKQKMAARRYAETHYDIFQRSKEVSEIFQKAQTRDIEQSIYKEVMRYYQKESNTLFQYIENSTLLLGAKLFVYNLLKRGK